MVLAENYSIEIRKGNFGLDGSTDFCYRALVKELSNLEGYADTASEAYSLVIDSINQTILYLVSNGQEVPKALPY